MPTNLYMNPAYSSLHLIFYFVVQLLLDFSGPSTSNTFAFWGSHLILNVIVHVLLHISKHSALQPVYPHILYDPVYIHPTEPFKGIYAKP